MTRQRAHEIARGLVAAYVESDADACDLDEYDEDEQERIREAMRDIAYKLRSNVGVHRALRPFG